MNGNKTAQTPKKTKTKNMDNGTPGNSEHKLDNEKNAKEGRVQ